MCGAGFRLLRYRRICVSGVGVGGVCIAVPVSAPSCMPWHTRLARFRRKAVVPCRVLRFAHVETYVSRHYGPRQGGTLSIRRVTYVWAYTSRRYGSCEWCRTPPTRRITYDKTCVSRHFGPRRGWNALCLSCDVCGGIRKLVLQFPDGAGCLPSGARRMPGHTQSARFRRGVAAPCRVLWSTHVWAYTNRHDGSRVEAGRSPSVARRMSGHTQCSTFEPPIRHAPRHVAGLPWHNGGYAGNQGTGY